MNAIVVTTLARSAVSANAPSRVRAWLAANVS